VTPTFPVTVVPRSRSSTSDIKYHLITMTVLISQSGQTAAQNNFTGGKKSLNNEK
jgi:hypothetical protein